MKNLIAFLFLALVVASVTSCRKKKEEPAPSSSTSATATIQISSFSADKTEIKVGQSVNLSIVAVGSSLSYLWSSTSGTILADQNDPSKATYLSCASCGSAGSTTVYCKVSDASSSIEKSINITIR